MLLAIPPSPSSAPSPSVGAKDARAATPRPELDDITLAKAKRSDPAACRALVDRYAGAVFSVVRRMRPAASSAEHEDLSQDIFLKVFGALPRFEIAGPAKLSTWILTIASRRCLDANRRKIPTLVDVADQSGLAASSRTDEAATLHDEQARVQAALLTLSEERRDVVTLRIFCDLSYDAIAQALAVDVGTVKSRLSRAKADLRVALEETP